MFQPNLLRTDRDMGNSLKTSQIGNFPLAPSVRQIAVNALETYQEAWMLAV
jgi:hypothetical protein